MNRIDQIFTDCRAAERKALMPFVTAGYPTLDTTAAILPALESVERAEARIVFHSSGARYFHVLSSDPVPGPPKNLRIFDRQ